MTSLLNFLSVSSPLLSTDFFGIAHPTFVQAFRDKGIINRQRHLPSNVSNKAAFVNAVFAAAKKQRTGIPTRSAAVADNRTRYASTPLSLAVHAMPDGMRRPSFMQTCVLQRQTPACRTMR